MTCGFAHHDGAYVLGALSPAERLELERHMTGCEECTRAVGELAGLPGLLGRVDASVLEQADAEPLPDTLLPALSREVRRARRRRIVTTVGLAAAAVVAAGVLPLVVSQLDDAPPQGTSQPAPTPTDDVRPHAMDPVGDVPVLAELALEPVTWGTRLDLTCTYDPELVEYELPPTAVYGLFVRTRDGHAEQVGTWRSAGGKTMRLSAATAASRDEISSVEVRTTDGRVVLKLTA